MKYAPFIRELVRLASGLLLLCTSSAIAGTLSVSPVRVELPADGSPKVLELHNPANHSSLVQVEAVVWREAADIDNAPRADKILAVPPVFEVAPDGRQLVRLALRRPLDGPKEEAYRLLITEVPRTVSMAGNSLALAVRLNSPIFVAPEGAEPDPIWSIRQRQDGAELIVVNRGNAHVRLKGVQLTRRNDEAPVFETDGVTYVLAGEELSWPIDLPDTQLDGPLTLKAETNVGPLETTVSWPEG